MNILTDEEMKQIHADTFGKGVQSFARAIEAAVLSKLAEQDVEPVALDLPDYHEEAMGCGLEDRNITNRYEAMQYGWDCAIDRVADRNHDAGYTEAQYIAAQQRTAEACAKAVERLIGGDGLCADDGVWIHDCSEAIRNGDWREYL